MWKIVEKKLNDDVENCGSFKSFGFIYIYRLVNFSILWKIISFIYICVYLNSKLRSQSTILKIKKSSLNLFKI